jgi:hypothetical protein
MMTIAMKPLAQAAKSSGASHLRDECTGEDITLMPVSEKGSLTRSSVDEIADSAPLCTSGTRSIRPAILVSNANGIRNLTEADHHTQ